MKILLDYVFPISVVTPTPEASTAFLKQVCVVCKPKSGQEANVGNIYECTSMTLVGNRTDNTNAQQLFNAGMSKVYILLADDLNLASALADGAASDFYTLLISDDFADEDITATTATLTKSYLTFAAKTAGSDGNDISVEFLDTGTAGSEAVTVTGTGTDKKISVSMESGVSTCTQLKTAIDASTAAAALITVGIAATHGSDTQTAFAETNLADGGLLEIGTFEGVVGMASDDKDFLATNAAVENQVAFYGSVANGAKSMFYAFGKLLANASSWKNQQYITMPLDDGIGTLGDATSLFDEKISFALNDDEFGKRLALFAVGGKAIVAPYILKNLRIDLQSAALTWITANQPSYTKKEAALLETRLQQDVINTDYIDRGLIESGSVDISLVNSNFVATGDIAVAEPKALWRVVSQMTQS